MINQPTLQQQPKRHLCEHDLDEREWFQLRMIAFRKGETVKQLVSRVLREQLGKDEK